MKMEGTVTSKGQLVIPAKLRKQYKIGPGTRVKFVAMNDGIGVYPQMGDAIDSVRGMLAGLGLPPNIDREPDRDIS